MNKARRIQEEGASKIVDKEESFMISKPWSMKLCEFQLIFERALKFKIGRLKLEYMIHVLENASTFELDGSDIPKQKGMPSVSSVCVFTTSVRK